MDKKNIHPILFYTPAIGWGILICVFSLMPSKELPQMLQSAKDYILHFGIYGLLGILLLAGKAKFTVQPTEGKLRNAFFIGAFAMGICIEVMQGTLIQGRSFELKDVLFNTLGLAFIFPVNYFLAKIKKT